MSYPSCSAVEASAGLFILSFKMASVLEYECLLGMCKKLSVHSFCLFVFLSLPFACKVVLMSLPSFYMAVKRSQIHI